MNRQILISAIFALALSILSEPAGAQDFKKAIRQHYVDAKTYVDDIQAVAAGGDIYPVPQCFTTHITQNLPGTGYHQEDISMYYREILSSDDQIYPSLALEFATKKYNFAAREFYEEYLYDDKQQIQFIFATTPDLAPMLITPANCVSTSSTARLPRYSSSRAPFQAEHPPPSIPARPSPRNTVHTIRHAMTPRN